MVFASYLGGVCGVLIDPILWLLAFGLVCFLKKLPLPAIYLAGAVLAGLFSAAVRSLAQWKSFTPDEALWLTILHISAFFILITLFIAIHRARSKAKKNSENRSGNEGDDTKFL